ncbi:MAG: hypothetical protein ABIP03_01030 [Aquihabitans sp.]
MAGPGGAATVVVAQPDDAARELLARVVEAAGHIAVRLDASAPPDVVEATVEASANLLIVDLASVSQGELMAMIEALTIRRFPAPVVALADGPASGALAVAAGAAQYLARPFHQRDLTTLLTALLDPAHADQASVAGIDEPDAETSLLGAIDRLPPIDELPDLPTVDGDPSVPHDQPGGWDDMAESSAVTCAVEPLDAVHLADDPDEYDTDDVSSSVLDDHHVGLDASAEVVPGEPDPSSDPAEPSPDGTSGSHTDHDPAEADDAEVAVKADEPTPVAVSNGATGALDTFTDILKMGRQL